MNIFTRLQGIQDNDDYYIIDNSKTKVYTEKSFRRETSQLVSVLEKMRSENKSLLWISPFHEKIYTDIPKILKEKLIWIAPVVFKGFSKANQHNIIVSNNDLTYFLNSIKKTDSFLVETHHSLKKYQFNSEIHNLLLQGAVRLKTIDHFQKVWEFNFKINQTRWSSFKDIRNLKVKKPDLIILGGPSIDSQHNTIRKSKNIWCADTALPLLNSLELIPDVIFTLDAGYGSYEHFIKAIEKKITSKTIAIVDPLSFPQILRIPFREIFTYSHSNPLVQNINHSFTELKNNSNDVYGLINSVFNLLFNEELPEIIGFDGGHIRKITHMRGSAYHQRQYGVCNRLITPEKYFFQLSDRYTPL